MIQGMRFYLFIFYLALPFYSYSMPPKSKAKIQDLNLKNSVSLFWSALRDHDTKTVQELCTDQLLNTKQGRETPLGYVARVGNCELAKVLLNAGADIMQNSARGADPLRVAAQNKRIKLAALFLTYARTTLTDPGEFTKFLESRDNKHRATALRSAAWWGATEVITMLLIEGADRETQDKQGNTPLWATAWQGEIKGLEALLRAKVNKETPNKRGSTPLFAAAWKGRQVCLESLVMAGANIRAKDTIYGFTPLHGAAHQGHIKCVKYLVDTARLQLKPQDFKAYINGPSKFGTPLWTAARNGQHGTLIELLRAGANKETPDVRGSTPLFIAVWRGHQACAKSLINAGANIRTKDRIHGSTPLYAAAWEGYSKCVGYLIEAARLQLNPQDFKRYINEPSNEGNTPLDSALKRLSKEKSAKKKKVALIANLEKVVELLKSAGGKIVKYNPPKG